MKTVTLHGKNAAGRVALVDDGDCELVMRFRWNLHDYRRRNDVRLVPYAVTRVTIEGTQKTIGMHRLIAGWPLTDHVNHDGLDNQRHNLRQVTQAQNSANARPRGGTSAYKGVLWNRRERRWKARITVSGRRRELGSFTSEADAARAYDAAAVEAFGAYAYPNFPENAVQLSEGEWQAQWDAWADQREAFQALILANVPMSHAEWWTHRAPDPRTCTVCGTTYLSRCSKQTLYCGPRCCRRAQTLRARAARAAAAA